MSDRLRMAVATARSAPWRRAPVLLRGRPGVLATVLAAAAVLAASVAAVPLFLSSVGTAAVALQAAERCPRDTGASLPFTPTPSAVTERGPDPFSPVADRLHPSNRWARIDDVFLSPSADAIGKRASVLVRDDAFDHLELVEGSPGPGLWISDRATELLGLRAGDTARLADLEVPIAGVYRDLSGSTVDDYWCANGDMVLLTAAAGDLVPPPLLLLADETTFASLLAALPEPTTSGAWDASLRDDLTAAQTEQLVAELACAPGGAELPWCGDGQPPLPRRIGRFDQEPVFATSDGQFVEAYLGSHLPFVTKRSRAIQTSVGGGIWPIAGLGALAGLGLIAAAASLWFDRRRRAVTLLAVRGVSPAGLGLKGALELAPGLVVGIGLGVAVAHALVVRLGPSGAIEPRALRQALAAGAVTLLVAVGAVVAVVAWRSRAHLGRSRRRVRAAALPWELLLGWLTWVSYRRLGDWGVPIGRGAGVSHVDVLGLLFPLLFLLTVVAVASRILGWVAPSLRAATGAAPTPLHLGVRRVTRHRTAVLGLVAAAAISAGVLAYAATMSRSLDATLAAKATTFVGSDVALRLAVDEPLPPDIEERATAVDVYVSAHLGAQRDAVAVVAIDPATFARAARWDPTYADQPLAALLEALDRPPVDGLVPALVVGADVSPGDVVTILDQGTNDVPLGPVGDVRTFPGMRLVSPTVIVARSALEDIGLANVSEEVWIRGDRGAILESLDAAGVDYVESREAGAVVDGASFLTVRWTFGFMQTLGASAGLLALGGVVVYLDARRRDRLLGYAFMRRMGLRRRQHRRALAIELTASVLVGSTLGLATALVAAWLTHVQVDPVPKYQPDPLLRAATPVFVGIAVLAVLVVVAGAALAQRRVDRDDPVEVLRAGT